MPEYSYRASNAQGRMETGVISAESRTVALTSLKSRGLVPLSLGEPGEAEMERRGFGSGRISKKEVLAFTQQMAALLASGTQMDRALAILNELTTGKPVGRMVSQIRQDVQSGAAFSDALSRFPRQFNTYYLSMVRAGEAGGVLPLILGRLAQVLDDDQEMRGRVLASLAYPLVLVVFSILALAFLMIWIVPMFEQILIQAGGTLPVVTRMVIGVSRALTHYGWVLALALVGGSFWLGSHYRSPEGRLRIDGAILRLPGLGEMVRRMRTAQMARTLGTMLQSGVPLVKGLAIVQRTVGNQVLANALEQTIGGIREGGSVAAHLRTQKAFPALAVHMIGVGEETGRLEEMLDSVARTYDREVQTSIRSFLSLLEPLLIILMTFFIGGIIFAILLPILTIWQTI